MLQSEKMNLSSAEKGWLSWLGNTGKLAMLWSCFLNRRNYLTVEKTFEGIAATRVDILQLWVAAQWNRLSRLSELLHDDLAGPENLAILSQALGTAEDFSELFLIDPQGKVSLSTYARRNGVRDLNPRAVEAGCGDIFLHGPYLDDATVAIGPSTSEFHDAVTLMFYQPIVRNGRTVSCLCGRVPNDVIGDLIQREAGHVFRESGDNYLFMVESRFDQTVHPGTALSRSRFEDDTFSYGDNLKQGVPTRWGTVRVSRHTELELRFVDPATGELHPGVRETIKNGSNLFVTYPGYSDYRHIPVIGKGVTFQLKGSPDRWGMMCEGDLEEVYRNRSINYKLSRAFLLAAGAPTLGAVGLAATGVPMVTLASAALGLLAISAVLFQATACRPIGRRLKAIISSVLDIAECGGNLKQRLDLGIFTQDETGELAKWNNSFLDKLDGIVSRVTGAAEELTRHAQSVSAITANVALRSHRQSGLSAGTAAAVEQMSQTMSQVAANTADSERVAKQASLLSSEGETVVSAVATKIRAVSAAVQSTSSLIQSLDERSSQIGRVVDLINEIAGQTNLLALNAAIEAARAGEQGRGFAVVASEVRELAKRTTSATTEISAIISSILSDTSSAASAVQQALTEVNDGVSLTGRAAESLNEINAGARRSLDMISDMVAATRQQSEANAEIARNVEDIALMATEVNGAIHEASAAASQLEQVSMNLQNLVAMFKV